MTEPRWLSSVVSDNELVATFAGGGDGSQLHRGGSGPSEGDGTAAGVIRDTWDGRRGAVPRGPLWMPGPSASAVDSSPTGAAGCSTHGVRSYRVASRAATAPPLQPAFSTGPARSGRP